MCWLSAVPELQTLPDPEYQSSRLNRDYNRTVNPVVSLQLQGQFPGHRLVLDWSDFCAITQFALSVQLVEPFSTGVNPLLLRKQCGQCRTWSSSGGLLPVCVYCAQSSSNACCCCEVQNDATKPMRHINYHCTNTFHILQFCFPPACAFLTPDDDACGCGSYWMPLNKHMANTMAKSCRENEIKKS